MSGSTSWPPAGARGCCSAAEGVGPSPSWPRPVNIAWSRLIRASCSPKALRSGRASGEAEVHHLTDERIYEETPADVLALCSGCHQAAHARGVGRAEER